MSWISRQPRLTQIYAVVVSQLNDVGIFPGGAEVKAWIKQEIADHGITADAQEIATLLSGLLSEGAIKQADINTLMRRNNAQPIPRA